MEEKMKTGKILFISFLTIITQLLFGYKTLKTEHFYIHYPDEINQQAVLEIGSWAEGAYKILQNLYHYDPAPIHVEVHNESDIPNGNASVTPFNKVNYYIIEADYDSEIGFRNWPQSLFIHELTHIFEMDATRGYSSVLRAVFGKPPFNPFNTAKIDPFNFITASILPPIMPPFFTTPNTVNPTWFHEGAAVFNESFFADDGRLNSTEYNTRYRENALFGFADIDQFTSYFTLNTPYPYGSGIFSEIYTILGKKENFTGDLSNIHAGRFYFFFDGGISTLFEDKKIQNAEDFSYTGVYEAFKKNEQKRQEEKLSRLASKPLTKPALLLNREEQREDIKAFTLSPSEKKAYFITESDLKWDFFSGYSRDSLYVYDIERNKVKKLFKGYFTGHRLEIGATGKYLYTHIYKKNNTQIFSVPVRYNLEKDALETLSESLVRFYDIAPSPKEDKIVGIKIDEQGKKHIEVYVLADKKAIRLADNIRGIKPFFISDEKIVFPQYDFEKGQTDFIQADMNTKESSVLFSIEGKVRDPYLKESTIYFSCDKNGVYNLYSYQTTDKKVKILTNVETKAYFPTVQDGQIYFVYSALSGYNIASIEMKSIPDYQELASVKEKRIASSPYEKVKVSENIEDYWAIQYLRPYWWLPYATFDGYDRWNLGIFTSWNDPLERHSLFLMANYDLKHSNYNYEFQYNFTGDEGILVTLISRKFQTIQQKIETRENYLQNLLLGYQLRTFDYTLSFKAGGFYNYYYYLITGYKDHDRYGPSAFIDFSTRDFYRESFRQEDGISLSANYNHYYVNNSLVASNKRQYDEITGNLKMSLGGIIFQKGVLSFLNTASGAFGKYIDLSKEEALNDNKIYRHYSLGSLYLPEYKNLPIGETSADQNYLRGYESGQAGGNYYLAGSLEYLIPLFDMMGGIANWPVYFRGIYINGFLDYALTSNKSFKDLLDQGAYYSYGGELGISTLLFYTVAADFLIGYAYNVQYATNQLYFTVKIPFGSGTDIQNIGVSNREFDQNLKMMD